MLTAVVVAGGDPPARAVLEELPEAAWIVAADSGLDHAGSLGLRVDVVVGDLDSVSAAVLARHADVPRIRHPKDKDASDLELALGLVASRSEVERVIVVGGTGGRLDHLLANASVVCSPAFAHLEVEWVAGTARMVVVRDHARLHGTPGELVTLLPMHGPARGVTTSGLRWRLDGEDLPAGTSRGVSNEFTRSVAEVRVESGTLLVVQPEAVAD